ncbi:MAG: hypothetical protein ACRDRW_03350 [Pseudonocardiaceae bacterium]
MSEHEFDGHVVGFIVDAPTEVAEEIGVYFARGTSARTDRVRLVLTADAARLHRQVEQVTSRPALGSASGHPQTRYRWWSPQPDVRLLIPDTGPAHLIEADGSVGVTVTVLAAESATLARTTIRIMRELLIRSIERDGGILGHAAVVVINGRAIVLAGRPGSGKTTVALTLAGCHGAALCAADRCLLLPDASCGWRALAVPLAWRIAPGTVRTLSALAAAVTHRFTAHRGPGLYEGKHEFVTGELAALLNGPATPVAPGAVIVVLDHAPARPAGLVPVAPDGRDSAVLATMLRREDALFTTDWLGLPALPAKTPTATESTGAALAATIPIYRGNWASHIELATLAELVVDLPELTSGRS